MHHIQPPVPTPPLGFPTSPSCMARGLLRWFRLLHTIRKRLSQVLASGTARALEVVQNCAIPGQCKRRVEAVAEDKRRTEELAEQIITRFVSMCFFLYLFYDQGQAFCLYFLTYQFFLLYAGGVLLCGTTQGTHEHQVESKSHTTTHKQICRNVGKLIHSVTTPSSLMHTQRAVLQRERKGSCKRQVTLVMVLGRILRAQCAHYRLSTEAIKEEAKYISPLL